MTQRRVPLSVPSLVRLKRCGKCKVTYPLTCKFFPLSNPTKCRVCSKLASRQWRQKNLARARQFDRDRYGQRQEEMVEYGRRYRKENAEAISKSRRLKREEDPESYRAKRRAYREENAEAIKAYRQKNKDKIDAYFRAHYRDNKDYYAEKDRRRRAQKRGNGYEPYGKADIFDMWYEQNGLCYYCQTPLFASYDIEHMLPISRGGRDALDNICLSCKPCNWAKRSKTAEEYLEHLKLP